MRANILSNARDGQGSLPDFIQMAKAAGGEKEDGEDSSVIGGVNQGAGRQGLGPQAHPQSTRLTANSTANGAQACAS